VDTDTNERTEQVIAGLEAQVDSDAANLQKLKTGGDLDGLQLDTDVATTDARFNCRQAVVDETPAGGPPGQPPPFVWSDDDPCALEQLPGKTPPYLDQDIRPNAPAPAGPGGQAAEPGANGLVRRGPGAPTEDLSGQTAADSKDHPTPVPVRGMRVDRPPTRLLEATASISDAGP
jgi:hypothetical protein